MAQQSGVPVRFGIIGTGGMGSSHAREIAAREDARVVAACDINDAAIDRFLGRVPALKGSDLTRFTEVAALAAGHKARRRPRPIGARLSWEGLLALPSGTPRAGGIPSRCVLAGLV